jgi:hypothetical protein
MKNICFFTLSVAISLAALAADITKDPKTGRVIPGSYNVGTNGEYYIETNANRFWEEGVWQENTNNYWRVIICFWDTNTPNSWVSIGVGSKAVNSGGGYYKAPHEKCAKFELANINNGTIIQPKEGASLEEQFPKSISVHDFPRWPDGQIKGLFGFLSNSPPAQLKEFRIRDIYNIVEEGDYTLTVSPVIYKYGTNADYLDRVDLPSVTTKIHLTSLP